MPDYDAHADDPSEQAPAPRRRGTLALIGIIATFVVLAGWIAAGALRTVAPTSHADATPPAAPPVVEVAAAPEAPTGGPSGGAPVDATTTQDAAAPAALARSNAARVDADWAERTAQATGIPSRALLAYAGAELAMALEAPGCGIRWNTLAGIGRIESGHGAHGGSAVGADGVTRPGIFGIDLTGEASARITDTDGGAWDGKADIDRAVGPMQFIPATWETWGADGDGDGVRDPQQIDDAALAAARYLCHAGDLSTPQTWRDAIFSYNHLDSYVDSVAAAANEYAARATP